MSHKLKIFILVGATATGKTKTAIELAKRFPIEIINADSLQIFRHLDIGTAKPSADILKTFPHHLIDIRNPDETFTAKDFKRLAEETITNITSRKKIPLFVGGAGFYLKALVQPSMDLPEGTQAIENFAHAYKTLHSKDPDISAKIHPNDHYRISRAMFLLEKGILPSSAYKENNQDAPFDVTWMGLMMDRNVLRQRITDRVHEMYTAGLLDETKNVLKQFPESKERLSKSIGYRECLDVLDQKILIQKAIDQTIVQTQQYAKRQGTWFRKNPTIQWSSPEKAVEHFSFFMKGSFQV